MRLHVGTRQTMSLQSRLQADRAVIWLIPLFRIHIPKRRRVRIFNLSVRTRLFPDKTAFDVTCPENTTFPRTKLFNAVFTPGVQPAHTRRGRRTSVHGLWRQFPRLWHNRGLHHKYRNSYSPGHQACRAGWTGARWYGS